jgi:hypothetical protein
VAACREVGTWPVGPVTRWLREALSDAP